MASIQEIIKNESSDSKLIHLYREGIFLKGYEQSAYLFITHVKPYQVKTKYFKNAGQWVSSTGFPVHSPAAIAMDDRNLEVYQRIVSFDLANRTPMQCAMFLSEIQQQLKEKLQCVL
jgi:hypothetical protein